jgi:Domain of unknown function (DUF4349)
VSSRRTNRLSGSFRRIVPILLIVVLAAVACAGDGDEAGDGIGLDQPIGAPVEGSDPGVAAVPAATEPSVAKTAAVEMDVVGEKLTSAAQAVVDLATEPKTGGFLVSSIIDTDEGNGFGEVVVKVPSPTFEQVVGALESIGKITRQQLEGQDLTPDALAARSDSNRLSGKIAALLASLDEAQEPAVRFRLRENLREARAQLRSVEQNRAYIESQTTYSTINVHLAGIQPPPAPEKPAFERAFATAKALSITIGSAALMAAGVIVPVGVLLLLVYVALAPIVRRLRGRPGWGASA